MWLSGTEDYDPVPERFDVEGAVADAAYDALCDRDRWPVFRIPFGGGHTALVLHHNLPDDLGTEYLITHPGTRPGRLATVGGHHAGPGLPGRSRRTSPGRPTPTPRASTPSTYARSSRCPRSATGTRPETPWTRSPTRRGGRA
ncbi:hypothetical protein [Streptomyces huiliensis]|uniref:hypothetical protein n=1 Tax=Streptomyces huiliensis TaxID=2876027 RepID=UPI001CC0A313|nr:hypothetical protein [Streptomyces huiliensis]